MNLFKYFSQRLKKIGWMLNHYTDEDLKLFKKIVIVGDLCLSIIVYGCGITDYFQYQFYKKSMKERKTFIVHRKRMWLVRTFNNSGKRCLFDHKPSFNSTFNDYLGRLWLDISKASFEDFKGFVLKTKRFLVKPVFGSHGIGVKILEPDYETLEVLYAELQAEAALLEEIIEQHSELAEFNPSSVNTLRVVTLLTGDGEAKVMTANLRLGNGEDRFADNFHHNGIAALIDVESGRVISRGVDKNLNYYDKHPVSGKKIEGFTVPQWKDVFGLVKTVAQLVPEVRYVGWDLAVGKEGQVMLVEGNAAADPDISQMPDQVGKWSLFREVLSEMKGAS